MKMKSGSYHKNCFRCGDCRIYLDYSLASDGPTGDVFCKNCYGKNFGPLSRNMESATAMDTAVIKPSRVILVRNKVDCYPYFSWR